MQNKSNYSEESHMKTSETACLTSIVNKNDIPGRMAEITATI